MSLGGVEPPRSLVRSKAAGSAGRDVSWHRVRGSRPSAQLERLVTSLEVQRGVAHQEGVEPSRARLEGERPLLRLVLGDALRSRTEPWRVCNAPRSLELRVHASDRRESHPRSWFGRPVPSCSATVARAAFRSRTGSAPIPTVSTTSVLMRRLVESLGNAPSRSACKAKQQPSASDPKAGPPGIEPGSEVLEASLRPSLVPILLRFPTRLAACCSLSRTGVTYGFRSRRGRIHSAPGSPAPSRHSLSGENRTLFGSDPNGVPHQSATLRSFIPVERTASARRSLAALPTGVEPVSPLRQRGCDTSRIRQQERSRRESNATASV